MFASSFYHSTGIVFLVMVLRISHAGAEWPGSGIVVHAKLRVDAAFFKRIKERGEVMASELRTQIFKDICTIFTLGSLKSAFRPCVKVELKLFHVFFHHRRRVVRDSTHRYRRYRRLRWIKLPLVTWLDKSCTHFVHAERPGVCCPFLNLGGHQPQSCVT